MINRELIRLKVVQLVYTNYKNSGKSLDDAMKELTFSLAKSYDLYRYLLLLIPEITDYACMLYESTCERIKNIGGKEMPNPRFVNNRFAGQLSENKELNAFAENSKNHKWTEAESEIRSLYKKIIESSIYNLYMNADVDDYAADREFWRKIYKKFICENESLETFMEEWSLYWNDDKFIVDTFVLKTIKRFDEKKGAEQLLLSAYEGDEDRSFAEKLFSSVLLHRSEYEDMIKNSTKNWDFDRLPIMDIVIMVTALAEIINFPSIQTNVSFNEYLNIAKVYSSPKSAPYINGILDHIVHELENENKLTK